MNAHHIPAIARWLENQPDPDLADFARFADPMSDVTLLFTASRSDRFPVFPEDVLAAWQHTLASEATAIDQSTLAFILEAERAEWPAVRIALALGLEDEQKLPKFREMVAARLVYRHPWSIAARKGKSS